MSERFLLDTNVISELARKAPDARVVAFIGQLDDLIVPSIALFEIERGIRRLPSGKRRVGLERWLAEWLAPPIVVLAFDAASARTAAKIEEAARKAGRAIDTHDLFVVAMASVHELTVATRNVRDFRAHGVRVMDPFEPQ